MVYGVYKNCRDAVWKCLIECDIKTLPVPVIPIAKHFGISVIKDSLVHELRKGESGISIFNGTGWIIVYDDSESRQRKRFTVAHELGHILLGHEMKKGFYLRSSSVHKPLLETEADVFASRLLAPACVLWGLNLHDADEISRICDMSISASQIRARRMKILYERNMFLTSPLEREVYIRFSDYIESSSK